MAGKRRRRKQRSQEVAEDYVQVGIYQIPASVADLYLALHQAVVAETIEWLEAKQVAAEVQEHPEEGQVIVGHLGERLIFRLPVSPDVLSQAQEARDKNQLDKFLEQYFQVN